MANLNVTYGDLTTAAQQLVGGKDDLNTKLSELSNIVTNLTNHGFQAEHSSAAYADSYQKVTTGVRNAIDGLDGLSKFLTQAADALQQTDQGLANAIQN
jgi:WXG100 family type VII secretion target